MAREWEIKRLIVDIGKRIWTRGYVAANDGNISVRISDNEVLTTPTGVSKGFMTTEMIIKIDMEGNVLASSSQYRPSSEAKMHLEVYKQRPDVKSVVHAHPPFCTSFAVAGIPLDKCVLPEAIIVIGSVPIAGYGLPSTMEIPDKIRPHIKKSDAILLENHGALTLGSDLINAYYKMETLEHTAHIVWNAIQLGNVNILPENERDRLLSLREKYNLTGKVEACDVTPLNIVPSEKKIVTTNYTTDDGVSEDVIREVTKKVIEKLRS